MKHIRFLEESGLIVTRKARRLRSSALEKKRFALVDGWLAEQRAIREGRTERLALSSPGTTGRGRIEPESFDDLLEWGAIRPGSRQPAGSC